MTITFDKWRVSHKYIRIQHNKRVNKWFKIKPNNSKSRTNLRNSLLIYSKDSAQQITAKITYFNSIQIEYLDIEIPVNLDEWELKAGRDIPQLAIIYRPIGKNSKSGNYVTHIPHYKGNRKPKFTNVDKGNYWARLVLKDNTQIRVTSDTEKKAQLLIKQLSKYVDRKFITNNLKFGSFGLDKRKELEVKPHRADYYEKGKEQSIPTWRIYF